MAVSLKFQQPFHGMATVTTYADGTGSDDNLLEEDDDCAIRGEGQRRLEFIPPITDQLNSGKCGVTLMDGDYTAVMRLTPVEERGQEEHNEHRSIYRIKCPPHQLHLHDDEPTMSGDRPIQVSMCPSIPGQASLLQPPTPTNIRSSLSHPHSPRPTLHVHTRWNKC